MPLLCVFDQKGIDKKENLLRKQEVFLLVTRTGIEPMLPP